MKVLKIEVGSVYIDGKSHKVYQDAWEKEAGVYEIKSRVYVRDVQTKQKEQPLSA